MPLHRVFCVLVVVGSLAGIGAEKFELQREWWQAAAVTTRHATLVCSFDRAGHDDADFARAFTGSGGFGMTSIAAGRHGTAVEIEELGGHLNFRGGSNVQSAHGTVRFAIKGGIWAIGKPRWVFSARGHDRIGVCIEPGKLSLIVSPRTRTDTAISRVDLPIGGIAADTWHTVVASWDRTAGKGWIALDGRGVSGEMTFSEDPRAAFAIYLGGDATYRTGGLNEPGSVFDDFVLYDVALPVLETAPTPLTEKDIAYLPVVEEAVRETLNYMADLQRWGGWQTLYTWPTLLGSTAQVRNFVDFDDYIDNDKGNGSCPLAAKFLWAYETLGDSRFLDVGLRTGEFVLAAQAPEGYWLHGYRMTVHGIKPAASPRSIKLQDQVQAHPMLLLTYLHRLTKQERYLVAVKKAGEFYLRAQNPNGSWPHHYDLIDSQGKTARGQPGGGELNDRAANDAADMMVLMYHLTGEAKYILALKRLGDWLLEAQGKAVPLWSDQYDAENNPAWARNFEPPAYGTTATTLACQALREIYRFSGDERYLEGIRHCDEWIKANLPNGQMSCFVDPVSGRPIAAWERKVYFLDEPASMKYLDTVPIGSGYRKKRNVGAVVARLLKQAEGPLPARSMLAPDAAMQSLAGKRNGAKAAIDSRNEAGVWTVPVVAAFIGSIGEGFGSTIPRAGAMIAYTEAARIAMGELTPRYPGSHNMLALAYPFPDWYEVKWQESLAE